MDFQNPELMLRHPDDALGQDLDAIVVGPGIGQGERAETLVGAALASDLPCVLDADALEPDLGKRGPAPRLRPAHAPTRSLTPHPAEAARLLALEHRRRAGRSASRRPRSSPRNLNAHVVLKGAGSILVARDGHWFVNTSGNPGMASAGMGDVLAGILGALLAQRYSGESALVLGVHLHGAAADDLVAPGVGPVGLTAGELIDAARRRWNAWLAETRRPSAGSQRTLSSFDFVAAEPARQPLRRRGLSPPSSPVLIQASCASVAGASQHGVPEKRRLLLGLPASVSASGSGPRCNAWRICRSVRDRPSVVHGNSSR